MIKITKLSEEKTYEKVVNKSVFEIDGKEVRVVDWRIDDPEMGNYENDSEINGADLEALTDVEHEAFGENLCELLDLKVGKSAKCN